MQRSRFCAGFLDSVGEDEQESRTSRWSEILQELSSGGATRQQPTASPDDLVVSIGSWTKRIAENLAIQLRRRHLHVDSVAQLDKVCMPCTSALVVTPKESLTLSALGVLNKVFQGAPGGYGVLVGYDELGLQFMAQKCVLGNGIAKSGNAVAHDAVFELNPWNSLVRPEGWQAASIMAHGEGGHLLLNGAVLCGLADGAEHMGGIVIPSGCRSGNCKRARHAGMKTIGIAEVRATCLALISCNSFSVAGQMYPSSTSLVIAAAEHWPSCIIANPTSMEFSKDDLDEIHALITGGTPIGTALQVLSSRFPASEWPPYILVGDPLSRHGMSSDPRVPSRPKVRMTLTIESNVDVDVPEQNSMSMGTVHPSKQWIEVLREMPQSDDMQSALVVLEEDAKSILESTRNWDAQFALLIQDCLLSPLSPVGDLVLQMLTYKREVIERGVGLPCGRCGTVGKLSVYQSPAFGSETWVEECPLCGPLHAGNGQMARLDVQVPCCHVADSSLWVSIRAPGNGYLVCELRDKSGATGPQRSIFETIAPNEPISLSYNMHGHGCDQHSFRAIWVGEQRIAYTRRVLSVLPGSVLTAEEPAPIS